MPDTHATAPRRGRRRPAPETDPRARQREILNIIAAALARIAVGQAPDMAPEDSGCEALELPQHTDAVAVEDGRLIASGVISRDTHAAREVVASARNGFPWQASLGASVESFEFLRENQSATVNGREVTGPVNIVRRSTLGEISFVDLGADGATTATIAASGPDDQGEPGSGGSGALAVGAGAPTTSTGDPVRNLRNQIAGEMDRIAAIRRLCAGAHPTIEAQAIREGWDATKCELEVLRASRPVPPSPQPHMGFAIHAHAGGSGARIGQRVLEAACVLSGRLTEPERHCDERDLEAASREFGQSIGLQELLLHAAWANGYTGRTFRDWHGVMDAAFGRGIQASGGNSTINISGILSNVANKFLLEGFFSVERTWRNITAVRSVTDFKTVTSYRLTGNDRYERVAPGGEIKHGTLGEESYTNKADTYALMLSIDRHDIINDDLGAITTVPRKLGAGSGKTLNEVFWSIFLANSAFFTAGNNNFIIYQRASASVELQATIGRTRFEQTDEHGLVHQIESRDYLVRTADLELEGERTLPRAGDQIKEVGCQRMFVYEVMSPGGEPPFRYSDPYRQTLRIHTKYVKMED